MKGISINRTRVEFSDRFNKQLQNTPDEIKAAFADALTLLLTDPTSPALRDHELHGIFAGYRSIDVTEDYRALFRETQTNEQKIIDFQQIGTHKELYGR